MKNFVILLHGAPASGKLTLAKALSEKLNFFLLDNHHFNDVIFPFVDVNAESLPLICETVYQIRALTLKVLSRYKKQSAKGFIFTNVLIDTPDDKAAVRELMDFARDIKGVFVPIRIACDTAVLLERVQSADRQEKCKLTDAGILQNFLTTQKFIDVPHPNSLALDSGKLSVEEMVTAIAAHLEKLSAENQ